ncbi:MAG: T9SS type A sorting domain-containing protein [Ignavibacteriota bacterium]
MFCFHAPGHDLTQSVRIRIDSIILNNGRDSLYTGTVSPMGISTALMPAPYGSLSGTVVVVAGSCTPELLTDITHPSTVSLDPPYPNPFTQKTTFEYTIAEDGPVRFALYDMLGQEIKTIVDQVQKQGHYAITFDGYGLGTGSYIARLNSGGVIRSRRIGVEK